ncbi:S-adenosyl-L-methionine-dependent methyltransferase [Umbelopsis sp. AD052]|nr:S-adenosyl-L-methionine-dependent methyltransferase [Umbelopsis sp. AD052]
MQNSIISQYTSIAPDTGTSISFNAPKRKWSSVLSSNDSPTPFHDNFLNQQRYDASESITPVYKNPSALIVPLRFPTLDKGIARSRSRSSSQIPTRDPSPSVHSQETNTPGDRSSAISFSLIVGVLASEMMAVKEAILQSIRSKSSEQGEQQWPVDEKFSSFVYQQLATPLKKETPPGQNSAQLARSEDPDIRNAVEFYCLLVAFMTVYVSFLEVSTSLMASKESLGFLTLPFETIMNSFDPFDNIFHDASEDMYFWYYVEQRYFLGSVTSSICKELQVLNFTVEKPHQAEAILSSFYTNHLLRFAAQRHQKDHGQFYTPTAVVDFMWTACMNDDAAWGSNVLNSNCPSVLDPCMGTGSFLSSYIERIVQCLQEKSTSWDNSDALKTMINSMCSNIWGIEIDHFVAQLGKLNVMLHIFPLLCRWMSITGQPLDFRLPRLNLFCNDILTLSLPPTNHFNNWEFEQLTKLRDPDLLKFEYMVTNPPYMIRKTGFIAMPDTSLYDMSLIGGRGSQAYMYFMWICLQRCHPLRGRLCFITPSQWILLEFAKNLRSWLWKNYILDVIYQFEPYKVWPKIQTDSLIFRLRPRSAAHLEKPCTLFLRHEDRTLSLDGVLSDYQSFSLKDPTTNTRISYRLTPATIKALDNVKDCSFSSLTPASPVSEQMKQLTQDFIKICGGSSDSSGVQPPLLWNRGPNTNPVYALLVRTDWALKTFGADVVEKWMRPAIYWNGKRENSTTGKSESKEILFWKDRDRLRVSHKENSPAEAYVPFRFEDLANEDKHYSMILVDNANASILESDGTDQPLYQYLKDAREKLQPKQTDKEIAWCPFRQCGIESPIKIVHPINFGYFSRSQPRQRFFLDTRRQCVTNQCMYFTIHPTSAVQDPLFYLGLLNSSTVQFFITIHCCYDQQGRTRFFAKNMANIPYPPSPSSDLVDIMVKLVTRISSVRSMIYMVAREQRMRVLIEKLRQGRWDLSCIACDNSNHTSEDTSLAGQAVNIRICPNKNICSCLRVASLLQYGVDQLSYLLYGVPVDTQLAVESELSIGTFTDFETVFPRQDAIIPAWYDRIIQYSDLILSSVDL